MSINTKVFIASKKYDCDPTKGFWVELPCNIEEVTEKLAAITGEKAESIEILIKQYDSDIKCLQISERDDFNELNKAFEKAAALDEYELNKLCSVIEGYCRNIIEAFDYIDDFDYYDQMTLDDFIYDFINEMDLSPFAKDYFDYELFKSDLKHYGYYESSKGVLYDLSYC